MHYITDWEKHGHQPVMLCNFNIIGAGTENKDNVTCLSCREILDFRTRLAAVEKERDELRELVEKLEKLQKVADLCVKRQVGLIDLEMMLDALEEKEPTT